MKKSILNRDGYSNIPSNTAESNTSSKLFEHPWVMYGGFDGISVPGGGVLYPGIYSEVGGDNGFILRLGSIAIESNGVCGGVNVWAVGPQCNFQVHFYFHYATYLPGELPPNPNGGGWNLVSFDNFVSNGALVSNGGQNVWWKVIITNFGPYYWMPPPIVFVNFYPQ